MVQGSLDFSDVDRNACISTATTQCSASLGGEITTPGTCLNDNDQLPSNIRDDLESQDSISTAESSTISCATGDSSG